jgi:hypothetical protein
VVIWRGWGWLILPFFLLVWFLAESVIVPIYRSATGYEFLFNADKGIAWAIAFAVIAPVILVFVLFALRPLERVPLNGQQWEAHRARKAAEAQLAAAGQTPPHPVHAKLYSSFFFIPMWVFPIIFILIGILLLAINIPVALAEAGPHRLL